MKGINEKVRWKYGNGMDGDIRHGVWVNEKVVWINEKVVWVTEKVVGK